MVSCAAADEPASTPVATNAASNERDVMKPPKALPRDVLVSAREFALPAARRRLNLGSTSRNRPAMTLLWQTEAPLQSLKCVASLAYQGGKRASPCRGRGYASGAGGCAGTVPQAGAGLFAWHLGDRRAASARSAVGTKRGRASPQAAWASALAQPHAE